MNTFRSEDILGLLDLKLSVELPQGANNENEAPRGANAFSKDGRIDETIEKTVHGINTFSPITRVQAEVRKNAIDIDLIKTIPKVMNNEMELVK